MCRRRPGLVALRIVQARNSRGRIAITEAQVHADAEHGRHSLHEQILRPHSALAGLTPDEIHAGAGRVWQLAA